MILAIIVGYNPTINFDSFTSINIEQATISAQTYGDDFEYAVEWPETWDAGCVVLCYGPGWGCEDWAGTGTGYEYYKPCGEVN